MFLEVLGLLILIYIGFLYWRQQREAELLTGLSEKPVFITGCDTGFGHDTAIKLTEMGLPVFAGCLTEEGVKKIQTEASNIPNAKLKPIQCDVSSDESVKKVGEFLEKECEPYGGLWAVINNAGVGEKLFFDDFLVLDDFRRTMEVNFFGMIRVVHQVRRLIKKKQGRIVNVTSAFGRVPPACIGPYVMSKHAATAYTDVLRKEYAVFGIKVITIEPGFVKTVLTNTDRIAKAIQHLWDRADDTLKAEYGEEFFKHAVKNQGNMMNMFGANTTQHVRDAYVSAVLSAHPRRRYKIGWDTNLLWHPLTMVPTNVQDGVFATLDALAGAPVPACLKKAAA